MAYLRKKLEFYLEKANKIHNNKYDYSKLNDDIFKGTMTKYEIICKDHGSWFVTMDNHIIKKSGCPKCKGFNLSFEEKIEKANKIHDNKYDYSLIISDFKNFDEVKILCKKHGEFIQSWSNHVHKLNGCPKCKKHKKVISLDEIKNRILKFNTNYEYDWDSFIGYFKKIDIKCNKHGWFKQQISNHLFGQGCPKCNNSNGENNIEIYLKENNIQYETQKTFNNCLNPKTNHKLKFDFYIPLFNLCIEYDGELHYKSLKHFGGDEGLKYIKYKDKIKTKYCKENNIKLLRIPYTKINKINQILIKNIK